MTTGLTEWNEESILAHLKQIASLQLAIKPEQVAKIGSDAPLVETLALDSLGQVVFVTTVEADFGCSFEPEDWQRLQTVDDLVKMIASRVCREQGS